MAMKQAGEYLRGLRYKFRMFGIPVDGPAFICGDNQSVLANSTRPELTIKKKSQSIAYNFFREGCAADCDDVAWSVGSTGWGEVGQVSDMYHPLGCLCDRPSLYRLDR